MEEKNLLQFKQGKNNKGKKVHCPCCTNTRLMDMVYAEEAELEIKCQNCGRTIHLYLEHDQIHAIAVKQPENVFLMASIFWNDPWGVKISGGKL